MSIGGTKASEDLRVSDDDESGNAGTSWTKLKEILILRPGGWRVKWQHISDESDAWTRIYKNAVPYGEIWLISTAAWQSEEEDLGFAVGDLCQLWGDRSLGATCKVRNFRLYAEAVYGEWGEVKSV